MNEQMTNHLTTEQLDSLLFNAETDASHDHLRACATCAAELAGLRSTFVSLRSTTAAVAAQQRHIAARRVTAPARNLRAIGSFAAAALVLAISIPATLHWTASSHPAIANQPVHTPTTTNTVASNLTASNLTDEQLLTTVQSDLSASVPQPMLPLASTTSTSTSTH